MTPQAIEAVLADFRSWLAQAASTAKEEGGRMKNDEGTHPSSFILDPSGEPLDLHTLLGQFVALRHEVNLQTKATRAQHEQSTETLSRLDEALEALEQGRTASVPVAAPGDESVRTLLKTLVDLYDNLALARREVQRVQEVLEPCLDQLAPADISAGHEPAQAPSLFPPREEGAPESPACRLPEPLRRSLWARWFGARGDDDDVASLRQEAAARLKELRILRERQAQSRQAAARVAQLVASLITGYTMSLQRVERVLQQSGLEAIAATGLPFDPETMEVLEVIYEDGRTASAVIEEVRRGYVWRGQVFRFAQVRVARPQPG
jgi:molecular chaperone GrpE